MRVTSPIPSQGQMSCFNSTRGFRVRVRDVQGGHVHGYVALFIHPALGLLKLGLS